MQWRGKLFHSYYRDLTFVASVHSSLTEQAWYGIIGKIAHLLGPLLAPAPMIGSKDDRIKRANNIVYSKRHLIDFCLAESSTFLSVKKFQLAGRSEAYADICI